MVESSLDAHAHAWRYPPRWRGARTRACWRPPSTPWTRARWPTTPTRLWRRSPAPGASGSAWASTPRRATRCSRGRSRGGTARRASGTGCLEEKTARTPRPRRGARTRAPSTPKRRRSATTTRTFRKRFRKRPDAFRRFGNALVARPVRVAVRRDARAVRVQGGVRRGNLVPSEGGRRRARADARRAGPGFVVDGGRALRLLQGRRRGGRGARAKAPARPARERRPGETRRPIVWVAAGHHRDGLRARPRSGRRGGGRARASPPRRRQASTATPPPSASPRAALAARACALSADEAYARLKDAARAHDVETARARGELGRAEAGTEATMDAARARAS